MAAKRFEDTKNIDRRLRAAYLHVHKGQGPDDFVETAEGGWVDSKLWSREVAEFDRAVPHELDQTLAAFNPRVLDEDGNLRWD